MSASSIFNDNRDVMAFVRIPKTGSTSFATIFQAAVGPERSEKLPDRRIDSWDMGLERTHDHLRRLGVRVIDGVKRLNGRLAGRRDSFAEAQFLHGHHPLWALLPTSRSAHYVALVRNPIDRFLSQYFCIRGKAEARPGGGSIEKRRVLEMEPVDFVQWLLASPVQRRLNGQCLYLAPSGTLEDARSALEIKVLAVAPVTDLGELALVVSDVMGVPAPEVRHENISHNRPRQNPLGPRVEARLRQALEPDIQLCDYVLEDRDRLLDPQRLE